MNQTTSSTASQEDISQRARELWESYGRPEGRDTEIWLEAERQLLGVDAQVVSSGNASISAPALDEATSHEKPRTRVGKSAPVRKPAAEPAEKPTKSAKAPSSTKAEPSAKIPALAKTGGTKALTKIGATIRPKR